MRRHSLVTPTRSTSALQPLADRMLLKVGPLREVAQMNHAFVKNTFLIVSAPPWRRGLGTAQTPGSVAVPDVEGEVRDSPAPGERGRVQVVMREALGAWWGERVLLREAAAGRTLAGGRVLDPWSLVRYRRAPCAWPNSMRSPPARPSGTCAHGSQWRRTGVAAQAEQAAADVLAALALFHQQHPDEVGRGRNSQAENRFDLVRGSRSVKNMEGKRSWWIGRASNPSGVAM